MSGFGEFLRTCRFAAGLSQRQLASLLGINSGHLSRIEGGQKNPPKRKTVLRIAQVLELDQQQSKKLFEAAGYLAPKPENKETLAEPPGFHSTLRPNRNMVRLSLPAHRVQLQGLAQKALEQVTSLLAREDLKPRQRGKLAREIISFTRFLQTKLKSADSQAE